VLAHGWRVRDDAAMRKVWKLATVLAATTLAGVSACAPLPDRPAPAGPENCNKDTLSTLYPGILTFGADQPVYPPWYIGDNPANGEGFESAIAYAVAAKLKYSRDDVRWVRVPFNAALAPGPKTFDANLSEFSITEQRKAAVDFSSPYFDVTQAVVTVKTSPAAGATSLQALKSLRLGAQVGTTSHTAAAALDGSMPVEAYNTNSDAKMALSTGEIDALVTDLPTAFAVANELRDGTMVGQFPSGSEEVEQFGIVLDKDSPLTPCVSWVIDGLREDGTLAQLAQSWLTDAGKAPVLR
jgi:polar amino acid transport system substrate-binding protein